MWRIKWQPSTWPACAGLVGSIVALCQTFGNGVCIIGVLKRIVCVCIAAALNDVTDVVSIVSTRD